MPVGDIRKFGDVVAGREGAALGTEEDDTDGFVRLGAFQGFAPGLIHCIGESVFLVRSRESDFEHAIFCLELDMFAHLGLCIDRLRSLRGPRDRYALNPTLRQQIR